MSESGITVLDVLRSLNLEPKSEVTWSVGAAAREIYKARYGRLPEKALRKKTAGGGSHCFAVYPVEMRAEIETLIRNHILEPERQGNLL